MLSAKDSTIVTEKDHHGLPLSHSQPRRAGLPSVSGSVMLASLPLNDSAMPDILGGVEGSCQERSVFAADLRRWSQIEISKTLPRINTDDTDGIG